MLFIVLFIRQNDVFCHICKATGLSTDDCLSSSSILYNVSITTVNLLVNTVN